MKAILVYTLLALAAVALGVGLGVEYCRYQYMDVEEPFYSGQWDQSVRDQMRPILVVAGGLEHDFGRITTGTACRREFIFENRGDAVLEIQLTDCSENATVDIGRDKQTIPAGASLPVEFTWTPGGQGEQSGYCQFVTNDLAGGHDQVRLVVTGR